MRWLSAALREGATNGRLFVPALLLLMLVLAGFGRTLSFGLTGYDDQHLLTGVAVSNPSAFFFANVIKFENTLFYYRPMLLLSFWLTDRLSFHGVFSHHLANLLLHWAACLCLWRLLVELGCRRGRALAAAGLFALHPLQTTAVALLACRNDSLLAIAVMLTVLAAMRYLRNGSWPWLVAAMVAWIVALLTKETAVMLPLMVVPLAMLPVVGKRPGSRRWLSLAAGLAAGGCCYWLLRSHAASLEGADMSAQLNPALVMISLIGSYLGKAFLPWSLDPIARPETVGLAALAVGLAVAAVVLAVAIAADRRRFIIGIAWAVIFIIPSVAMANGFGASFESRMYLPLAGLLIATAGIWDRTVVVPKHRLALAMTMVAVYALCVVRIAMYCGVFHDQRTFWDRAARSNPTSAEVLYNAGIVAAMGGDQQGAAALLQRAASFAPGAAQVWFASAMVAETRGEDRWALYLLNRSLQCDPQNLQARQAATQLSTRAGRGAIARIAPHRGGAH